MPLGGPMDLQLIGRDTRNVSEVGCAGIPLWQRHDRDPFDADVDSQTTLLELQFVVAHQTQTGL